jgi:hypothetical protein
MLNFIFKIDLFDTLTWAEILVKTTFLGTLIWLSPDADNIGGLHFFRLNLQ